MKISDAALRMERVDQRIPARSERAGVHTGVLPAVRREPRLWGCLGVLPFAQIKFQPVHLRRARFHCGRHGSSGRLLNRFFLRLRPQRSEEHTSELQLRRDLVCRLLLEKKKKACARTIAAAVIRSRSRTFDCYIRSTVESLMLTNTFGVFFFF